MHKKNPKQHNKQQQQKLAAQMSMSDFKTAWKS